MPIIQSSGGSGISNLLNSFSPMGMGGSTSAEVNSFLIYLRSKIFEAQVVKALDLLPVFFPGDGNVATRLTEEQKLNLACARLGGMVKITNDRLFMQKITISAVSEDPQFAAKLVRQYLVELQNFIANNVLTQSKRRRLFLEKELAKKRKETLEMGKVMARFYGQNPVSLVRGTINVPVAVYTNKGVRDFKNYEEFKANYDVLQEKDSSVSGHEIQYVPDVPHQLYLKYSSIQQQILESSYVALSQAFEIAKDEEVKQEPSFQILEEPFVPINRFSPDRKGMAKTGFLISLLLGIGWSFYREFFSSQYRLKPIDVDDEEKLLATAEIT